MATPNIVPRADSEGGLGTASKYWASAYIDAIYVSAGFVGRDADNNVDFSVDDRIQFEIAGSVRTKMTSTTFFPATNDGVSLGTSSESWSDLYLASGAVINFDNGNFTLTHGTDAIRIDDGMQFRVGSGNDLRLYHTGGTSYVSNENGGNLEIRNLVNDADVILSCDDGSGGVTPYLTLDGSSVMLYNHVHTLYLDTKRAYFGTGFDLEIYHDTANSYISHLGTGDLIIQNTSDDKDIIFKSDDGSGGTTAYLTLDGTWKEAKFTVDAKWTDSKKARFGDSDDLGIYHNGSHSYIQANGTGTLIISQDTVDQDITFKCDNGAGGSTTYFYLDGSSATHDGSATTALYTNWPDNSRISLGTSHDLMMYHNGTHSWIWNDVGDLYITNAQNDGDIIFRSDDGSGGVETYFYLDGSMNTDGTPKTVFPDNSKLQFGSGASDLRIYHDATNSYIQNNTGDLYIQNGADGKDIILRSDDGSGGQTAYITLDGSTNRVNFSKAIKIADSIDLNLGGGLDLRLQHNGTDSFITNHTGDLKIINYADDKDIIFQSDNGSGGVATYFYLDGSASSSNPITIFPDLSALYFGTGTDLMIRHDGTDSTIANNGGDFYITQNTNDKDLIFQCDDGSGGTTTYMLLDGSSTKVKFQVDAKWNDNDKAIFGNGEDLKIYHNGTNNMIDSVFGDISIRQLADDKDIRFRCDDGAGGETDYVLLDGSEVSTKILTQKVIMSNLPTSDPTNAGQLWNDSGTLKISAG